MNPSKEWDYCHIENLYCGEFPVIWNGKKCDINLFDLPFFHFQIEASIQWHDKATMSSVMIVMYDLK